MAFKDLHDMGDDFEAPSSNWIDGGSDCRRSINDQAYASSGNYCCRLRDDSFSSYMSTNTLNLSTTEELIIEFSYRARSMDNSSEGFILEISTDNGASYVTIADWYMGLDFQNGQQLFESVSYDGPMTSQSVIRFRCDGSTNYDYVYIDDVSITTCNSSPATAPSLIDLISNVATDEITLALYPNPADSEVTIDFDLDQDQSAQLSFYDISGQLVYEQAFKHYTDGKHSQVVNVTQLPEGMFYAVMTTNGKQITKKFIIIRE